MPRCSWWLPMRLREYVRGLKRSRLNGGSVVFNRATSTACLWLWPRRPQRNFTNRSSRKPRGGESFAISWMFRSFAIFTIRRWCNAERCKLPFLLPDKARPSRNVCESNLRNSLARNTKRGLRISAKRETSYSPENYGGRSHPRLLKLRWSPRLAAIEVAQMQIPIMRGRVYLMGAGPGDPDLLPAEAVSLLRAAEVVLHDEAVSPEVLELVPASAQVRNVDRLIEREAVSRDKVLSLLISAARDGRQVVRLKSEDALSPERVAEELEALVRANVDCELISGARSALATAAGKNSAR